MKNSWKDLKRSIKVLKCIHAWNISKFCIKIKTVRVWRNQPYVPCFKSLKMCMVAPSSLLDCTCRMLIRRSIETSRAIRRNLFRLWSQRSVVDIKRHEYIICNLFHKKTHWTRVGIDTKVMKTDLDQQYRHLVMIFENLEATLKTGTAFSNLSCS